MGSFMTARRHVWLIALVALATSTLAQERPSFSGRWVLVQGSNVDFPLAKSLQVQQFDETRLTRITITREFAGNSNRSEQYSIGLVQGSVEPDESETSFSAKWDDGALVLIAAEYPEGRWRDRRSRIATERWSVEPEGRLLVNITIRETGTEPKSTSAQYTKQ
jgi:hypothetical protein